jgi:hypothetical protein
MSQINTALAPTVGNAGSLTAPTVGTANIIPSGLTNAGALAVPELPAGFIPPVSNIPTLGQIGTGLQVVGKGAEMLAPKPPQGGPNRPAPVMAARNQIPYTKPAPRGMGRFGGM